MTTSVKKATFCITSIFMLIAMAIPFITPTTYASPDPSTPEGPGIEEEYAYVSNLDASVGFSGGNAVCTCGARVRVNHSALVVMYLKKDGNIVSTWSYPVSSGQQITATETYGAVSGSTYLVTTKAKVYDASGQLVEIALMDSVALVCP